MLTSCVYYCWSCDAHRRLAPAEDGTANCPRCQELLSPDCQLRELVVLTPPRHEGLTHSQSDRSGLPQVANPLSALG